MKKFLMFLSNPLSMIFSQRTLFQNMEKHQVVEIRIIPDFNRDGKVDVDFYLKGVDGPMNLREFEGSFRKDFSQFNKGE